MRRRVGLFLFCGLVLPLIVAASASAQGAIIELNPKSGPPGTPINVTGSGFNNSTTTTTFTGAQLRLSTRDAEPIKTATVTQSAISDTFPIPAGTAPGEYLVIATQLSVRGQHTFGTPARAKLLVTAGAAGASAPPARSISQATVAIGGVMVALILLAGGTLAVRRQRTSHSPLGS